MILSLFLACTCGGGCHLIPDIPDPLNLPAARAKNLEQLHGPRGEYRYHAVLLGDFGYLVESLTGRDRETYMSPSEVDNPGKETLENLAELLGSSRDRSRSADLQIQWCARLVNQDSSALVRERAAIGLGDLGHWKGIQTLSQPPGPGQAAKPDQVAATLEGLLRSLRLASEGTGEPGGVAAACASALNLPLDMDGSWRLLSIMPELIDLSVSQEARQALGDLRSHLQNLLIEGGIIASLSDSSDRVRVAGLRAMVKVVGTRGLVGDLSRPLPGWSETVVLGFVDIVAEFGLPSEGISEQLRGQCLASLLKWALDHPSERVRVRSMIALQRTLPNGPRSLREEDWFAWEKMLRTASNGS